MRLRLPELVLTNEAFYTSLSLWNETSLILVKNENEYIYVYILIRNQKYNPIKGKWLRIILTDCKIILIDCKNISALVMMGKNSIMASSMPSDKWRLLKDTYGDKSIIWLDI